MSPYGVVIVLLAIAVVIAIVVAWTATIMERVDPRIDATSVDWRNMARHRARFEDSERARRAIRERMR